MPHGAQWRRSQYFEGEVRTAQANFARLRHARRIELYKNEREECISTGKSCCPFDHELSIQEQRLFLNVMEREISARDPVTIPEPLLECSALRAAKHPKRDWRLIPTLTVAKSNDQQSLVHPKG